MSSMANLNDLFANSGLEDEAVNALNAAADDLGPAIMAGLGDVTLDELDATETTLVQLVVDDSSSIAMADNTQHVIDGHNGMLDALGASKAAGAILASCRLLNGGVVYPLVPLSQAVRLDTSNYRPGGGTPLYDTVLAALATVAAKASEFEDGGVTVRTVTFWVSDGADVGSNQKPGAVLPVVQGLVRSEVHIVGGMGISDAPDTCGRCYAGLKGVQLVATTEKLYGSPALACPSCRRAVATDFVAVYEAMGVQPRWILTPANDPSEIRKAFGTVSQSAVQASQTAGAFSSTALGGFGTN